MVSFSFQATNATGGEGAVESPVAASTLGSTAPSPSSFPLPAEELAEWRILQAETRALQAEAVLAVRERSDKLQSLLILWKDRYKIDDMKNWSLNIEKRSIERIERNGTRQP